MKNTRDNALWLAARITKETGRVPSSLCMAHDCEVERILSAECVIFYLDEADRSEAKFRAR